MARLNVVVWPEDIREGIPGDKCECPVALALRRASIARPVVTSLEISGWQGSPTAKKGQTVFIVRAPDSVRRFIEAFDDEARVKPFSFELELPEVR